MPKFFGSLALGLLFWGTLECRAQTPGPDLLGDPLPINVNGPEEMKGTDQHATSDDKPATPSQGGETSSQGNTAMPSEVGVPGPLAQDSGPCCEGAEPEGHCHRFLEWFTYRPVRTPLRGGGCGCKCGCVPPLYLYFLNDCHNCGSGSCGSSCGAGGCAGNSQPAVFPGR